MSEEERSPWPSLLEFCPCGKTLVTSGSDGWKFCPFCGHDLGQLDASADLRACLDSYRGLRVEDLLPRGAVHLDQTAVREYLGGKVVLVTGGGGSIGRQLCRSVIEAGAAKLLALGRSENGVFEAVLDLQEVAGDCEIVPVICCVRDREALDRIFDQHHPDVIFHAAAHKHVPLMELYPAEAIKNNVIGTLNLVELAVTHGVGRFVLVSTDKAVHPSSIMGASKQVAERIVRAYAEETGASMVSVRFGNVLGSRGSVVPTMMRQIGRRLPVTVTHPDMIRYFMTIPEAVDLILQAGISVGHGETFILKMGHPVKIMDLACDLIRAAGLVPNIDIPVRIIGLRPGEKLSEDLLTEEEKGYAQVGEHFYVVPGGSLDFQYVKMAVEELRTAASNGDREAIIAVLGEIIPDFAPKGRVVRPEDPGDEAALDAIEEASR